MSLSELCIKRPVFTIVINLILIVVGVICYHRLAVRELPAINKPVALIQTDYTGASAELMESRITTPIENALSSVSGIDQIVSTSSRGQSNIRITFTLDANLDDAVNDVRNAIARMRQSLPEQADQPQVIKSDPDATQTVIMSFSDSNLNAMALTDYVDRYIKPQMEELSGVGQVNIYGERQYAMRIWLDPRKMAARNITVSDITSALAAQNVNIATGQIKAKNRYYTVIVNSNLNSVQQFRNLIIHQSNGNFVRLGDVARVTVGPETIDGIMRVNGKTAIGVGVYAQSTANPITVAAHVLKSLQRIKNNLPQGMQVQVVYNAALFIKKSINNVYHTIFEAIVFVLIVIYLFLGSVRSSLIPIVTIPICLVATFAGLVILQYSINTITLLALVLAIGLVVDDAIVVLENIHRHIESGLSSRAAAIKGSREIVFAVIAMTVTLAAVYAPVGFTRGMSGSLFSQFAFTLAFAVVISGFVALTLTPMLAARLLKPRHQRNCYSQFLDGFFVRLNASYQVLLAGVLQRRIVVVITLIALATAGILVYQHMPQQLAPLEDQGSIMVIANAPTDASLSYTDRYMRQIETLYNKIPEIKNYLTVVGDNSAFSFINLKNWDERTRSQTAISDQLQLAMNHVVGVTAFPVQQSPLARAGSTHHALNMQVIASSDYNDLHQSVLRLLNAAKKSPVLTNLSDDLNIDSQQYQVNVNHELAADLNIKLSDLNDALAVLLGGNTITHFQFDGQTYDVLLQMKQRQLHDLSGLNNIYLRNQNNKMIPLANLVSISNVIGPTAMPHFNRLRSDQISAELAPGYSMSDGINTLRTLAKKILPDNTQFMFTGAAARFLEAHSSLNTAFLLALIFIYLTLAAQFESFIDPFIILLSVPLTLVAAIFTLKLTGGSLNIYSEIGLITLIGLVAKHGILITEFANQLQEQGLPKQQAIVQAATLRLRPILMTTAAMVLGALPLAFATGAGAMSRQQLGWVIVGGMLFGSLFSLFVVPTAYSYLARSKVPENEYC